MSKINELGIGAFRPDTSVSGAHKGVKGMMSPTADADSLFSRNMQRLAYENEEIDEDLLPEEINEAVLSCRVKVGRKYKLVETLDNLDEFPNYSDKYKMMADKINNRSGERLNKANTIDELDEMSAGGVAGVAVPLGYTSKGEPETKIQRKKRQKFNREKSYPYK